MNETLTLKLTSTTTFTLTLTYPLEFEVVNFNRNNKTYSKCAVIFVQCLQETERCIVDLKKSYSSQFVLHVMCLVIACWCGSCYAHTIC